MPAKNVAAPVQRVGGDRTARQFSPGELILVHVPPGVIDADNDLVWTPALVVGNYDHTGYHVLVGAGVRWTPNLFTMRIK